MLLVLLIGALSAAADEPDPVASSGTTVSATTDEPPPDRPDSDPAEPDEDSTSADTLATDQSSVFTDILARAKRAYFSGSHDIALDLLRGLEVRLLQGEEPNWEHAAEAMIFNGELLLAAGHADPADAAFRWVLERDLEYPLSPYHHPLDVVGHFEMVRKAVQEEQAQPEPDQAPPDPAQSRPRPPPVTSYLPFGVPQFSSGRPAAGVLFGALQAGLGIASLATYAQLDDVNTSSVQHPLGWTDQQVSERVRNRRFLLQWPLTFAFYGAWIGSHAEARRVWQKRERQTLGLTVTPPQGIKSESRAQKRAGTISITGRF